MYFYIFLFFSNMFKKIMAHGPLGCMMHDFAPLCPFRSIWRVRNRRAFEVVKAWIKQLKILFYIFFFWDWVRLYIGDGSM